jgi:hypothetical protein
MAERDGFEPSQPRCRGPRRAGPRDNSACQCPGILASDSRRAVVARFVPCPASEARRQLRPGGTIGPIPAIAVGYRSDRLAAVPLGA